MRPVSAAVSMASAADDAVGDTTSVGAGSGSDGEGRTVGLGDSGEDEPSLSSAQAVITRARDTPTSVQVICTLHMIGP